MPDPIGRLPEGDWPADGLESVPRCPVCGCAQREVLYDDLRDWTFASAPGVWTLVRCRDCGAAYLDPRPTPTTIGLAYRRYYTHEVPRGPLRTLYRRLTRALLDAAHRRYFGTDHGIGDALLAATAQVALRLRRRTGILAAERRHIPPGWRGRLLDVGCGSGDFVAMARAWGFEAVGVDVDPVAVRQAQAKGLDVRLGGVEALDPATERFDGITMSHVLEHVHDPIDGLRRCAALLRPGGWVWIETPNVEAPGHARYGRHWRGLEAPRHLVIWSARALERALRATGFDRWEWLPLRSVCAFTFPASEAIAARVGCPRRTGPEELARWVQAAEAVSAPEAREFLVLRAWRLQP